MFEKNEFAVQTENIYLKEVKNLSKDICVSEDEEEISLTEKNDQELKLGFQEIDPELQLEFSEKDLELLSLKEDTEIKLGILEYDLDSLLSSELSSLKEDTEILPRVDKLEDVERLPNKKLLNKAENIDILDNEEKSLNINHKKSTLFSLERIYTYSKKCINLEKYSLLKIGVDKKISYLIEVCNKNINEQLESLKAKNISDINMYYKYNLNEYNDYISKCKIKIENNKNIIASYNKGLEDLYKNFEINWHEFVSLYYSKGDLEVLKQLELIYPRIKDCFSNFEFNNITNDIKNISEKNTESIISIFKEIKIKRIQILEINDTNLKIEEEIAETNQSIEDLNYQYIKLCDSIYSLNYDNYRDFFKEDKKIAINNDLLCILKTNKLEFNNNLIIKLKNITTSDIGDNFKSEIIELINDLIEFNLMEVYSEKVKNEKTTIELDYIWKEYYNKVMNSSFKDNKLVYKDNIFHEKILEVIKETDNDEIITNKLFVPTQEHILRKYLFENAQDFILAFYNKLLCENEEEIFKNFYNESLNVLCEEENFNFSLPLDDYYPNKIEILEGLKFELTKYITALINKKDTETLKSFLYTFVNSFPDLGLYDVYCDFEKAYNKVKILERKINYIFKPPADYILNYDPWQKKIIKKNYNYFKGYNDKLASTNLEKQTQEPQYNINEIKEIPFPESNKFEQQIQKLKNVDSPTLKDKLDIIIKDNCDHKPIKPCNNLLKTPEKRDSNNEYEGGQKLPEYRNIKENVKPEFSYFQGYKNQLFTPQKKLNQQKSHLEADIKILKSKTPILRVGGPINIR